MAKVIELKTKRMKWNVKDIAFLYPPDVFTGAFVNEIMEARHREEMQKKLDTLKRTIAKEDDPLKAMSALHKNDHLQFLQNNVEEFRKAGRLEEAVIALYTLTNTPYSSDRKTALWNELLDSCDRTKLYECGEPVTYSSTTVYRGSVSGFKDSLIWTPDKNSIERIAKRWEDPDLGGGDLFEMDIQKEDVLVFLKLRRGDEVILSPQCIKSAKMRNYVKKG